jgi:hypothetical protein
VSVIGVSKKNIKIWTQISAEKTDSIYSLESLDPGNLRASASPKKERRNRWKRPGFI